MKSTRRQDYVSKNSIFNDFARRASVRQYAIELRKQRKLQKEIIEDRKAEDAEVIDNQ